MAGISTHTISGHCALLRNNAACSRRVVTYVLIFTRSPCIRPAATCLCEKSLGTTMQRCCRNSSHTIHHNSQHIPLHHRVFGVAFPDPFYRNQSFPDFAVWYSEVFPESNKTRHIGPESTIIHVLVVLYLL